MNYRYMLSLAASASSYLSLLTSLLPNLYQGIIEVKEREINYPPFIYTYMNNIVCRLLLAEARTMSMNKTHRDIQVNNQKIERR